MHVLAGLGGSGKSRLALEIAHRAQQAGRRVWWVSVPQLNSGMREVANQLGAPGQQVDRAWLGEGSPTDLTWRMLDAWPEDWLLVFDNADDPQRLGPLAGPVSDGTGWLREPATARGSVIVTTRDGRESTWGAWSAVHPVPPLAADDAAVMLVNRAGESAGSYEQARRLAAELGGLPIALRAAADYLRTVARTRVWPGTAGITDFEDYRAAVKRRFESPPGAYDRELNEPLGLEIVQNVFDLSLDLLAQRGLTQAAPLLKLLACLDMAPIPYQALLGTGVLAESPLFSDFTPMKRVSVLDALADLGLIEPHLLREPQDPTLRNVVSLHPLVHGILRDDQDVRRRRLDYYGLNVRMLLAATERADPDLPDGWLVWGVVAPHAVSVARSALLGSERLGDRQVVAAALEIARRTARYLIAAGLVGPARDLVLPIVAGCGSFGFRETDREILGLRHEKARIDLERGDPVRAEAELRLVIAERTRLLGAEATETLASRHKLAKAMLDQGRWAEAEPMLLSIARVEDEVSGPEHSDTMFVKHSLARAVLALGRAVEAERMLRQVLLIGNRIWSPTAPATLYVRQTLARSLLEQGRPEAAAEEIAEALSLAPRPDAPLWRCGRCRAGCS
ncbi:tetratricopeptide repeat protein [Kitasatospora gansuensis]